ncbi:glycosyltransferase family 39 protein [Zavarzinia sp. CC-PAN008]|uniref:glycosyltransferase family 39 protein n=1 Tax=Zavarzinia sp. CC-PAN008 TaxID=3243332 RepID=UPI003F7493D6
MAGLVLLFLAVHVALRLVLTANAGSDDVEQIVLSQALRLDYGAGQAPLYPWLLYPLVQAFGPGLLALGLLRYGLVALLHLFLYLAARHLVVDPRLQVAAAWSPVLLYPIGWRLHEADATGVLAASLVAAMLWLVLRLLERRDWPGFGGLALVVGLGVLAQDWFAFAAAGLALALAWGAEGRTLLRDRRVLLIAAAAAGAGAVRLAGAAPWPGLAPPGDWPAALGALLLVPVLGAFPLWPLAAALLPQAWRGTALRGDPRPERGGRTLLLAPAATLALAAPWVVLVGQGDALTFRLYPALLPWCLWLFWRLERTGWQLRQVRALALVLGLAALAAVVARVLQPDIGILVCKACRMQMPYAAFTAGPAQAGFTGRGLILGGDAYVAGNLRMAYPLARVETPALPGLSAPSGTPGACLAAWHGLEDDAMPAALAGRLRDHGVDPATLPPPVTVRALLRGSGTALAPARPVGMRFILVPGGRGTCR